MPAGPAAAAVDTTVKTNLSAKPWSKRYSLPNANPCHTPVRTKNSPAISPSPAAPCPSAISAIQNIATDHNCFPYPEKAPPAQLEYIASPVGTNSATATSMAELLAATCANVMGAMRDDETIPRSAINYYSASHVPCWRKAAPCAPVFPTRRGARQWRA